jgi:hypothetical protein
MARFEEGGRFNLNAFLVLLVAGVLDQVANDIALVLKK